MSQSNSIYPISLTASDVLKAEHFVGIDGTQAGDGANAWGVGRSDAVKGDVVPLDTIGTTVVVVGAPIPAGSVVQSDANGAAIVKAGGVALGRLMPGEEATGAGARVEIMQFTN